MSATDDKIDELILEFRQLSVLVRNAMLNHEFVQHEMRNLGERMTSFESRLALLEKYSTIPTPPPATPPANGGAG